MLLYREYMLNYLHHYILQSMWHIILAHKTFQIKETFLNNL